MNNERQLLIEKLREATDNKSVWIEFNGHNILNPFVDETERFEVDPIEHYGLEKVKLAVDEYLTGNLGIEKQSATTIKVKSFDALRELTSDGKCWIKSLDPELTEDISQAVCDVLNGLPVEYNVFSLSDTVILIELDIPEGL